MTLDNKTILKIKELAQRRAKQEIINTVVLLRQCGLNEQEIGKTARSILEATEQQVAREMNDVD